MRLVLGGFNLIKWPVEFTVLFKYPTPPPITFYIHPYFLRVSMSWEREVGMDDLAILDEGITLLECKRCGDFWTVANCQQYNFLCLDCYINDLLEDEPPLPGALSLDEGYISAS